MWNLASLATLGTLRSDSTLFGRELYLAAIHLYKWLMKVPKRQGIEVLDLRISLNR
jgi:hypothetical protein